MPIMLCLNQFFPNYTGGTEFYVLKLAKSLIAKGKDVIIVTPNFENKHKSYEFDGVQVIQYDEPSQNSRSLLLGNSKPLGLNNFMQLLLDIKPDVVHFHEVFTGKGFGIFHVAEARKITRNVFATLHLPYYTCMRGDMLFRGNTTCNGIMYPNKCTECMYQQNGVAFPFLLRYFSGFLHAMGINLLSTNTKLGTALGYPFLIKRKINQLATLASISQKIITVSDWYKTILEQNGIGKTKICSIPSSFEKTHSNDADINTENGQLKLVYAGRLSKEKGLDLLLNSLARMDNKQISLDVYGQSTDSKYLQFLKSIHTGNTIVNWRGFIEHAQLLKELCNYDLLCVPSVFEMSPLIIKEAMLIKLPVLASDCKGNAALIKDGTNGFLFESGNIHSLASSLNKIFANKQLLLNVQSNIPEEANVDMALAHLDIYYQDLRK